MSRLEYIVKEKIGKFDREFKGTPQAKILALEEELEKAWLEIAVLQLENTKYKCLSEMDDDVKAVSKITIPVIQTDDKYIIKCKETLDKAH